MFIKRNNISHSITKHNLEERVTNIVDDFEEFVFDQFIKYAQSFFLLLYYAC